MAGGHLGINLHISEIISDILDPVVTLYKGGKEIISTEDMVARYEIKNEMNKRWSWSSYWRGMVYEEYVACTTCDGTQGYVWCDDEPELCSCEDGMDGVDDLGRVIITPGAMGALRRTRWEDKVGWDCGDLDRVYDGENVNPEDMQDYTVPMVMVGTDVVNLYPSLVIDKVVETVRRAVLDTEMKFEEVDYLEMARYVALNWPESKCRSSPLGRVLPKRRYNHGTRPGITGCGPMGAERGDQEQWDFPRVRIRRDEKRLLVATVLEIASGVMFHHHFYGFGGQKFRQMGGGPIGLRGTCTLARLVMQEFDKIWLDSVQQGGLVVELYMRYMDDGRKLLHPIKSGWRWVDGKMQFCGRWVEEDMLRSPLERTVELLKCTMGGGVDYL